MCIRDSTWGAYISDFLYSLIGYMTYLIPVWLIYPVIKHFFITKASVGWPSLTSLQLVKVIGWALVVISGSTLLSIFIEPSQTFLPYEGGGIIGSGISSNTLQPLSYVGTVLIFLTFLMIGLTLYTTAQISEVVRGSIQALPAGQIEAAISVGLSPYQRLKLIILPQALRSMIPSLTNQYLNCWKNSSLAILVGFTDFYSILNTIVNNAGHAVAIFSLILITYEAGSLTISVIMNNINNSVTKVKI